MEFLRIPQPSFQNVQGMALRPEGNETQTESPCGGDGVDDDDRSDDGLRTDYQ